MILRKTISIVLASAAMVSALPVCGAYVQHENLYFNLSTTPYEGEEGVLQAAVAIKDGRVNFAGDVYSGDITVPGFITVDGQKYAVTSVGDNCFAYQTKVTSVKLPSTIESIGQYAFRETKIRDITLPAAVEKVDIALFSRCDSLKTITSLAVVPPAAPATLSLGLNTPWITVYVPSSSVEAYKGATGWSLFVHIQTIISEQVKPTSITLVPGEYKGYVDSQFTLAATVLPEDAENKELTFTSTDTSVATVDAEGNVRITGEGECVIQAISVADPEVKGECKVTGEIDRRVFPQSIVVNPDRANLPVGQKFRIEATVLPADAFDKRVEFINTAPDVADVDSLGNVSILKTGVAMITVRSAVDHQIGEVVVVQARPDTVRLDGMLYKIYPDDATATLLGAEGECPEKIVLPVDFPGGFSDLRYYRLTMISERAFEGRTELKEIVIPETVDSIGISAFGKCVNLEKANIPEGIKVISAGLFSQTALREIVIPDAVYMIDNQAFMECRQLENVKIGKGLNIIYLMAFDKCPALKKIECEAVVPPAFFEAAPIPGLEINPFLKEIYATCELQVPEESIEAYKAANVWREFKTIRKLGYNGVESIEDAEEGRARYFTLDGIEVARPASGIYIRLQGGKAARVRIVR